MSAAKLMKIGRWVETRFTVQPQPPVPARGPVEAELDNLKKRLLEQLLGGVTDQSLAQAVLWAGTEAAALAWYSGYPILVLPELLAEKTAQATRHWERQQRLRRGTDFRAAA